MNWVTVVITLVLCLLPILFMARLPGRRTHPLRPLFEKNEILFSPEERALYLILRQAVGDDFEVFGKVRVTDILYPNKSADQRAARQIFRMLTGRRFQFVLCYKADLSVAGVVQMEEHGHHRKPTESIEDPLLEVCATTGLPVVRIPASPYYEPGEIRQQIMDEVRREPEFLPEPDGRKEPRISGLEHIKF